MLLLNNFPKFKKKYKKLFFTMLGLTVFLLLIIRFNEVSIKRIYSEKMGYIYRTLCYQNNVMIKDMAKADFRHGVRYVYKSPGKSRLVDFAGGYRVDLPRDTVYDFSLGAYSVSSESRKAGMKVFISRETSPYENGVGYIDYYNNRFFTAPEFQENNDITLYEDITRKIGDRFIRITSFRRMADNGLYNCYSYIYIPISPDFSEYYRVMVKSEEYSLRKIEDIIKSFQFIETVGYAGNEIDTKPVLPDWNEETRAFYDELTGDGEMLWGTHVLKAITTEGMSAEVQSLEKKLDYKFGLVMGYCYLSAEPPVEGLREAYDAGKITELTLQIATYNNQGLDSARNPNFDVLDGKSDELIKNYAKSLKEFGHPVLLRLNNEMNTDWTSYSGMAALGDPEIYKQVHTRVFNIFREEGVDNVIWIFNPQFGDYPPANWNNYMCYYPGNGQIQVLGITGYNTGEYYKDLYGDKWKSFNEIYSACSEEYQNSFSQVPWIITEFASASNGGDKAAWIRNMFYFMPEYKNIKAAVWFSHHDMDERPGKEAVISRFYNIDETENTLRAFKDGLHGKIPEKPLSETGGGSAQR